MASTGASTGFFSLADSEDLPTAKLEPPKIDKTTKKDDDDEDDNNDEDATPKSHVTLMSLPPEIHDQIARELIYPDALSLKHTSPYFYQLVYTGVRLKVEWLMSRRRLHLDCPDTHCDLGSDLRFCRGSVPLLMKYRREHMECESRPGLGCLVYDTPTCAHRRTPRTIQRWFRRRITVEMWWVLVAIVPLLFSSLWFVEMIKAWMQ